MLHPLPLDRDYPQQAIELMRAALELLDAAGEHAAALHLQHAISIAEREGRASSE